MISLDKMSAHVIGVLNMMLILSDGTGLALKMMLFICAVITAAALEAM